VNALDRFCGPLASVECRRAVRPPWLTWVRMLAGVPAAGIAIVVLWIWMLRRQIEAGFLPADLLTGGLLAVEIAQIVLALLLSPALIAGTIAGEKDRGTLAMLLASRLTASDIILGRLVGAFSQVAVLAVAALPMIVLFASLRQAGVVEFLLLVGLPLAVSFGAAGLTVAASTLARRGRDALMTVYLLEVLILSAVFFGSWASVQWIDWLGPLNPFAVLWPLVSFGVRWPAAVSTAAWIALGAAGTTVAVWQLRPAYKRHTGGSSRGRRERRRRVPPLGERPMLWKELYTDSGGTLGATGKWLSRLLVVLLIAGGATVLVTVILQYTHGDSQPLPFCGPIADAIGGSSILVLWLVQWGIGLRSAGVVSGERQRSTWDAILASPLDGREIIQAKTWGSLHALRWLIAATCFAWTAAVVAGGMTVGHYVSHLTLLAAGCAFMAAAGVAVSMSVVNTTRGMAATIGIWMGAAIATAVLAFLITIAGTLLGIAVAATHSLATGNNDLSNLGPGAARWMWDAVYLASRAGLYIAAAVSIVLWIAARFDRLAGRMGSFSLTKAAKDAIIAMNEVPAAPPKA